VVLPPPWFSLEVSLTAHFSEVETKNRYNPNWRARDSNYGIICILQLEDKAAGDYNLMGSQLPSIL
jgi:hypothetical protein